MDNSLKDEINMIDFIDNNNIDEIKNYSDDSILYYLFKRFIYDYIFYDSETNKLINNSDKNDKVKERFTKYISKLSDIELINNELDNIDFENNFIKLFNKKHKFSRKEFLHIISETYENDVDYIKQFTLDFPRQVVFINNKLIKSSTELFYILSKYNRIIDLDGNKYYTMNLVLLLICQTTFYLSYLKIFNHLNKIKQKELTKNNDHYQHMHVSHNGDINDHQNDCIKIYIDHNILEGFFLTKYNIIDIEHEKTIYEIHSQITFSINNEYCFISNKLNDTKLNNTKLNNTKLNDTKLNNTKLNDTKSDEDIDEYVIV
jgi:hypothetical protein